ncbi:MAG: transposase [Patescibacteria group bacterium]
MTAEKMNTESMTPFLAQVNQAHPEEYIVMVLDCASSHKSKDLNDPENVSLGLLPSYSSELNSAEQIWNVLRRKYFSNRVFASLDATTKQAEGGLDNMAADKNAIKSSTNWPWINAIMNAKYNY